MLAKLKLTAQSDFDPGVETDEQLWSLIKKLVQQIIKNPDNILRKPLNFSNKHLEIFNFGENLCMKCTFAWMPRPSLIVLHLSETPLEL